MVEDDSAIFFTANYKPFHYTSITLYAAILPDRTRDSSSTFLKQVIDESPYQLDYTYSDNGKEYRGTGQPRVS